MRKMRIRGDLQVDGDIVDKQGDPISGGGFVIGDWFFRPDVSTIAALGNDAYFEIVPHIVDKPFEVQVTFSPGATASRFFVGSYDGDSSVEAFVVPELAGNAISANLMLKPNETYYIQWDAADATPIVIRERSLA